MSLPAEGYVAAQLAAEPLHNVHDLLAKAVHAHPHWKAFTCGDTTLTCAEFERHVDAFARFLRHHVGLQPGERLAIQLGNCLQYPVATYAALKAGLVLVNTNPQYTRGEALHQFRDSGARALLVVEPLLPLIRSLRGETAIEQLIVARADDFERPRHEIDEPGAVGFMQALRLGEQCPPLDSVAGLERLALLQYTGGTTGVSKGAMISHRNLLANVLQCKELFLRPGLIEPGKDIRIAPLPLYHIMAFATNMLISVGLGIHTVFVRDARNLDELVAAMKHHPFTLMNGINTLFVGLMSHPEFDSIDFSRVKYANSGGAPLNSAIEQRWFERTGTLIREGFGLTETSPVVSTATPVTPHKPGCVGQPLVDTEIRAVRDDGSEAPPGEPGELWVRGPQVMQGYWQRPEETAQALLRHCRQFLTGYKVPGFVEIRDELPKTAVGKLLRRQLRDEARAAAG